MAPSQDQIKDLYVDLSGLMPSQDHIMDQYVDLAIEYLPCSQTHPSQYHVLRCKHTVMTDTVVPCGPNCFGEGPSTGFICHACDDHISDVDHQSNHDTKPAAKDVWLATFFAEHPEAFDTRLVWVSGEYLRQLQEDWRFWNAANAPRRSRASRTQETGRVDKRARRMTIERPRRWGPY